MRKIFFAALLIFSTITCFAQVDLGIFAGPQITSAGYSVNSEKQSTSNKYGFHLGANLKVPFENKLYFAPAVFYSLKGYKVKLNQPSPLPDSLAIDNNTTIHTFELAALFQYDFKNNPNHFFVKFGPSIDVQLYGKEKFNRRNNTAIDRQMVFSFTKYGRIGANMILQLGYETSNGIFFSGQYSHGIGNINNTDYGPYIVHRVYGLSIGKYIIKLKK